MSTTCQFISKLEAEIATDSTMDACISNIGHLYTLLSARCRDHLDFDIQDVHPQEFLQFCTAYYLTKHIMPGPGRND